jgi:iron complex transport system permease protein
VALTDQINDIVPIGARARRLGTALNILIDVDQLLAEGAVTPELAARLRASAKRQTGVAALNALLGFGAIAMAIGVCFITQSAAIAAALGLALFIAGAAGRALGALAWEKLAGVGMVTGALIFSGALAFLIDRPREGSLLIALVLLGAGIAARSRLLAALTPLALAGAIGGSTGYWHACYEIAIREPTLTIVLFSALGALALAASKKLAGDFAALALVFARVSAVLVNFGFWIGSLWGDTPGQLWRDPQDWAHPLIPAPVFVVGWAIVLLAGGAWGAVSGRRFLVNTAVVFGGIHFYTQLFEYLGPNPLALIIAGAATIALGLGLWSYNRKALA